MALNYSHRPMFSAHTAEDNLVSPMRIVNGYLVEGVPEKNGEGYARPRHVNREKNEESFDCGRDRGRGDNRCGSPEAVSNDIIDLLPTDPFGMDISTTVTAITGWLEDLEVDYGVFGRSSVGGASKEEYSLFAGLNLIWNNAIRFQSFPGSVQFGERLKMDAKANRDDGERDFGGALARYDFGSACNEGDTAGFNNESNSAYMMRMEEKAGGSTCCSDVDEGAPHKAFCSPLDYLETNTKGNHDDGERKFGATLARYGSGSACNEGDIAGFSNESNSAYMMRMEEKAGGSTCCSDVDEGAPDKTLSFALDYLETSAKGNHDDEGRDFGPALARYGSGSACNEKGIAGSNNGSNSSYEMRIEEKAEVSMRCSDEDEGAPHKALSFALGYLETDAKRNHADGERDYGAALARYGSGSACNGGDIVGFNNESNRAYMMRMEEKTGGSTCCSDVDEGAPHRALSFALDYLETETNTKGNQYDGERDFGAALSQYGSASACNEGDIAGFNNGSNSAYVMQIEEKAEGSTCCSDGGEGGPHRALSFALGYLGVKDLLSVQKVCRSLRSTVRTDSLLWRKIHIDQPLNERITDDILLQLTSRAQGNLQCLSLVECLRVTDDGVRRVLETNPQLTKLCVPGCTRLGIEGIVSIVKAFNSHKGTQGIKLLRIGGLYGVTHEHFEELTVLLGVDSRAQQNGQKPHFYHRGNLYLLCDDGRAIDVETCPRCQKLRLVYDCPAEGCQVKDRTAQVCRACRLCIPRCVQCGRCIVDNEYEETFCLELLCSDCFKQLLDCQDQQDRSIGPTKSCVPCEPS